MPNRAEAALAGRTAGSAGRRPHTAVLEPGRDAVLEPGRDAVLEPGRDRSAGRPWIDDPYARALRAGRGPLFLRRLTPPDRPDDAAGEGDLLPLDVERWCAAPDAADARVLDRCTGPVLDIGCGPGRLVAALAARGVRALGVDVSPAAVARTRRGGGAALRRSVFDRLPGEGRWGTVLLMDGNVGIGGDPVALLARLRAVAAPGSRLLAEAAPYDVDEHLTVRVEDAHGRHGRPFPWARLGAAALCRAAGAAGWTVTGRWTARDRTFLELGRPLPGQRTAPPTAGGRREHP
ncbi:methyltransferase domain-containing protein [Streptomyces sp. GMY01]|uniref:class I SAM-dependent methyltransferase n=1 Tax=Streptomyces sp. GMY02 TaxID=1333528 RepID=UPI00146B95D4|nr:class I SAM-dependent methyltransferase [Streptomyces sp. GMY02]NMO34812.1 methyltransferase domain-containing protein [Streptomyces sp. GMY02]